MFLTLGMVPLLAVASPSPRRLDLVVHVTHARFDEPLKCSLYRDPESWLGPVPARIARDTPRNGVASCTFADLPAGTYAVAVHQDRNGNGVMDYVLGIPKEPWGISRDPVVRLRSPTFGAAAFWFDGAPTRLRLRDMR